MIEQVTNESENEKPSYAGAITCVVIALLVKVFGKAVANVAVRSATKGRSPLDIAEKLNEAANSMAVADFIAGLFLLAGVVLLVRTFFERRNRCEPLRR